MNNIVPISDEQAKALQEGFKFGGATIDLAKSFGGYMAKVLGTLPEDLVGLFVADWVRVKRAENMARMSELAFERLTARGVEAPEPVSLSLALPLLESGGEEDRIELVDLWARLLAAAMDPKRSRAVRQTFVAAIKAMDPIDALVLSALESPVSRYQPTPADYLMHQLVVRRDEVEISLGRLIELRIMRDLDSRLGESSVNPSRIEFTVF